MVHCGVNDDFSFVPGGPLLASDKSTIFPEAPRSPASSTGLSPPHSEASGPPTRSQRLTRSLLGPRRPEAAGTNGDVIADLTPSGIGLVGPDPVTRDPWSSFDTSKNPEDSLNPLSPKNQNHTSGQVSRESPQDSAGAVLLPSGSLSSPDSDPDSSPSKPGFPTEVGDAGLPRELSSSLHIIKDPVDVNTAQGIHQLLQPPGNLEPSYVPFIRPHTMPDRPEGTLVLPSEDILPTSTMEDYWGSGDYLETVSFLGSEDDFAMVTSLPTDIQDMEDFNTEVYDTSFPTRVVPSLSSLHVFSSASFTPAYTTDLHTEPVPVHPSHGQPTPSQNNLSDDGLDLDWAEIFTIEPTEILLPDMNSLEYYTTLLAKENSSLGHRNNLTSKHVPRESIKTTHLAPTSTILTASRSIEMVSPDNSSWPEESSTDMSSGLGPANASSSDSTNLISPELVNASQPLLESSVMITPSMTLPIFLRGDSVTSSAHASVAPTSIISSPLAPLQPTATQLPSGDIFLSTSEVLLVVPSASEEQMLSVITTPEITPSTPSPTSVPPTGDPITDEGTGANSSLIGVTDGHLTTISSAAPRSTTVAPTTISSLTPGNTTPRPATPRGPLMTTASRTPQSTTSRQYLCNVTKPDMYLVRVGLPTGSTIAYAKSHIREILKSEFNRSVELQVVKAPPDFVFRTVSGPVVYTAVAVINALRRMAHSSAAILTVSPVYNVPDSYFQVHSVLQFVPSHVDVRICSFSERVERGLALAYAEARRRSLESTNFTVEIVNITTDSPKSVQKAPVDITFAIRDARGYVRGAEVSSHLRLLSMVEFSFYLSFPVLQIAEPFHYPELNMTHLLRSSWVKSVLLGVLDQRVNERTFQAKIERRLAQLLGEVLGSARRWKRATSVGNNSLQIVRASRLEGQDNPLEVVYFVEGPGGERVPAATSCSLLNRLDVQRAAIVLGYRLQAPLARPVEKVAAPPSETQNSNMWIIVGVVVPVLLVVLIIAILYWKLCRSDKLEFQPDAMSIQQRQKLQAPSVKGFDFAKLHLGQHSKDDIVVIQEPGPPPAPVKEMTPSENGEVPTPKSKASSTKASRSLCPDRISPSDGDSMVSEPSSPRESTEETLQPPATPPEGKQSRKAPKNGKSPQPNLDEQLSSASIFEHVDRMSRSADGTRRVSNKIQLIAMQPMPVPAQQSPAVTARVDSPLFKIQVALRHKSEIEHHRNKIRLRAKRKGHYDFPAMDDIMGSFGDTKDQQHIYQKAQQQIDKILQPDDHVHGAMEPRRRGRRSPKQRKKNQVNGSLTDADRDQLIGTDSDGTYKKYPGVNNVAYVVSGRDVLGESFAACHCAVSSCRGCQCMAPIELAINWAFPAGGRSPLHPPPLYATPRVSGWGSFRTERDSNYTGRIKYRVVVWTVLLSGVNQSNQGQESDYLPADDPTQADQIQPDALYSSRGLYTDELPSSARPRPVGGATGAQVHQLTQVGLSSRIGQIQCLMSHWSPITQVHGYPDCYSSPVLHMPRTSPREPSAPPANLDGPGSGYSSAPPEESSPPAHSSASLIKAIREELMRLSQKQSAVPSYHS
uniref:Si:dkeyp-27e10.3 n=1 Tax=Paramormyrops kingsleyae TaxID=1676925 RepID=A0A3B3QCB9_9TELE